MPDDDRRPPSPSEPREIAILWNVDDVRCFLLWDGKRYRLRLRRGEQIVAERSATDDAVLVAMARRWRQDYEKDGSVPARDGTS